MRALVVAVIVASVSMRGPARAGDLCGPGARHTGIAVDLDVKAADVHDVLRLISDVAHVNLVVSDDVAGKVTLRLKGVAWQRAACAIAGVHHLTITLEDNILLVRRAAPAR